MQDDQIDFEYIFNNLNVELHLIKMKLNNMEIINEFNNKLASNSLVLLICIYILSIGIFYSLYT